MEDQPNQFSGRVAVVGAGPVGLTSALALKARGLSPIVVEADPEDKPRRGSRALFIHNQPIAELEKLDPGLAKEILEEGLLWNARRYFYRGREFFVRAFNQVPDITYGSSLPQQVTERILRAACQRKGIEIRWNTSAIRMESREDGVSLLLSDGTQVSADFVIGADGAKSTVRKSVGIELKGEATDSRWVIIDLAALDDESDHKELSFHYAHPGVGGRNVLILPFKGGWRLDIEARTDEELHTFSDPAEIRNWLPNVMDARYCDKIDFVSTYRFYQLAAERFADSHRRVLLVGEAAHLFPPFGGRGLNSGIMDAASAAEAISLSLAEPTREARYRHVDAFEQDRREAAYFNMESAAIGVDMMAPRTLRDRIKREWLALRTRWSSNAARVLSSGPNGRAGGRPGKTLIY